MTIFEAPCEMCGRRDCLKVIYHDGRYCKYCIQEAILWERWSRSSTVVPLKQAARQDGISVGRRFTV